ncbi:hypothetical protein LCM23_14710 [Cytobacillus kochii]|uniref:FtsK/SpoIIIE domain-containing protein n=1 Tax=Cytobacillus kochii TaxID=859143 RepID=UPI001CD5E364|nr:FtsK/SpoIIIE domain-containing protein [Cytobacillus kochii]MCA1027347.1 hypothetical protein [Cytobacillus kochii]
MIELLAFPLALAGAALIPKLTNEKGDIKEIFENIGFGITRKDGEKIYPKFKKKLPIKDGEETIGTKYVYSIPKGLPATKIAEMESKLNIFSDGLNKPVILKYEEIVNRSRDDDNLYPKYLVVKVFNRDIPRMFPYNKLVKDYNSWSVPIGMGLEGLITHNFEKVPHMTVAGTTRFGKTVYLKMLLTYLIETHPDDVEVYIIDLKGGLEFSRYEQLKQVKMVASNPDEAHKMLTFINLLMQADYINFKKNYFSNIADTSIRRRRFIIVDEAAQLAPEKWMSKGEKEILGECQSKLGEIARIGGGLGYREVFCTQYPTSDSLPRSIKQNADAKISFRLPSDYASKVAIDTTGAEELPSNIQGRALFKTHELKGMQAPYISNNEMWSRLEKYQVSMVMEAKIDEHIEHSKEEESTGENLIKFG